MNKIKIKICGIKNESIIDCCINKGVEFFGLVFYEKSPRKISIETAIKLINYVKNKQITAIGVFVDHPINELKEIIKKTHLNYIQLHGSENFEYINTIKNEFKIQIIKSIGLKEKKDLLNMKKISNTDYFLFDYKPEVNELPGGNAKTFDWSLLKDLKLDKPWFLSGGININNIKDINKKILPYGIDISSGVEEKLGIKSSQKIIELLDKFNE